MSNRVKHIFEEKACRFLTLDVNRFTVDGVIGKVDGLTAVAAAVLSGQSGNLVHYVVAVRGDNMYWVFIVRAVDLKGDWRSAVNATGQGKLFPLSDFCQV